MAKKVPVTDYGKDHWSLLGYIETLCVESIKKGVGEIDYRKMRVNEKAHPLLWRNHDFPWQPGSGTRLAGYFLGTKLGDKRVDELRRLDDHDDVDCLDDLEAAGLVEILSLVNGFVRMTDKGREIAGRLRAHKSRGGFFSNFRVEATVGATG